MKTKTHGDMDELTESFCKLLSDAFIIGNGMVMLSGGQTPSNAYQKLGKRHTLPGYRLHVCLSDERYVPAIDERSNALLVQPLISSLNIEEGNFVHVDTALPIDIAAKKYESSLQQCLDMELRFRLGVLGLGSDGHTASLFSFDDIERGEGRLAIPVERPEGPDRISVTPALLARFEKIIFLVAGSAKRDILQQLLRSPETLPAGMAVRDCPDVEIWTDTEALP